MKKIMRYKTHVLIGVLTLLMVLLCLDAYRVVQLSNENAILRGTVAGLEIGSTQSLQTFIFIEQRNVAQIRELSAENQRFRDVCQMVHIDPNQVLNGTSVHSSNNQKPQKPTKNYKQYPKDL